MKSVTKKAGLVLVAVALAATGCSKSSPTTTSPLATATALTIDGKPANNKGTQDLSGKATFALNLDNDGSLYYFEPTVLKGTPGQKVTLTLKNVGNTKHNFTLAAQNINQDVNDPGTSATVTVTFPQTGSLPFHCEYHQNLGMSGELVTS
jgi:plastocyanin